MLIQMIIIQIITFAAVVYVLRRLMYTEASKELKRLQQLNQEGAEKLRELTKKMDETEKECREKVAVAEEEAKGIKIRAKEEAEEVKKEILEKARRESERIVKAASNSRERIRRELALQTREDAFDLTARIFKEILFPKAQEVSHRELVKEVIKEFEGIDKSRFDIKIKKGELISAYPLEKDEKSKLISCVSQRLGYKVPFEEKEDKSLIAGIIIKLGTFVIDGSLNNRLRQVGERLKMRG